MGKFCILVVLALVVATSARNAPFKDNAGGLKDQKNIPGFGDIFSGGSSNGLPFGGLGGGGIGSGFGGGGGGLGGVGLGGMSGPTGFGGLAGPGGVGGFGGAGGLGGLGGLGGDGAGNHGTVPFP
ncbi:hypothetical protein Lal_00047101 [Lupinus albus]|uniref:Uncharacterized protein n=1 Tax=Lupinus albus TaxID=3870 RepID=A0A6A5N417_LUPAL|nr:hypothetical protein Lalb_Chr02g0152981 [Lupinus albus]KAF1878433.1 hypothetical protein Lal_00047101 [Lupinus albus]